MIRIYFFYIQVEILKQYLHILVHLLHLNGVFILSLVYKKSETETEK